jgi:hypothetical protein
MPKSPKRRLPATLLTLSLLPILTLSGCQTPTPGISAATSSPPPVAICTVFKIITFDRLKDTEDTIRQVKDSNARRDALCGPSPPAITLPTPPAKTSAPDISPPVSRMKDRRASGADLLNRTPNFTPNLGEGVPGA